MTEKKEKFNNINIKSTKSQTQDIKDFKNEILFEEPQQFDVLLKNDKIQENQNEDISNLNINNELQNKIKETKIKEEFESRRTKSKYFEDINNSSIVKKEESMSEFNTNKKSQGSDFALFKMMNELGNKNSGSKVKTLESLEKFDLLNSINSQNPNNMINSKNNKKEREEGKENKGEISKIEEENIKTNDYVKSENSGFIPNNEKDEDEKTNINRMNIELFFKPDEENQEQFVKDTKNQIINDINELYENNELNLVKLNNHEIFNFITEYNNKSKDSLDYNPEYYKLTDINEKFLFRRNNFFSHNYFSHIITESEKQKNNYYSYEKIKKHKINYDENIPDFNFNRNSDLLNSKIKNNKIKREPKIGEIENISSFFYNFCLYEPNNVNNYNKNPKVKILDEKMEEELIKSISTYRKIYNDGHSFQRCFSFLLFETFLLKSKLKEINYLLYDMKNTLKYKFLNIDQALNILYQIKENDSINDLMDSFNSTEINIDEIMIAYIEDKINIINKIDIINKRKYQEINYIYFKTLCDIFDINLKILSLEENKSKNKFTNNSFFSINTLNINCESYEKFNKVTESNKSDELNQNYPTLNILFFINSYHIIYTNKSDIDSTLANSELSPQYYYLPNLPNYLCPKCNKNEALDIIPFYEAVFCHKCLINYMKDIIKNRVASFIQSGFTSIEYFTRPIGIKSEIKINFTLYKYITGNYLMKDFENIFNNTCFICYKYFNFFKKKSDKNINATNINSNAKLFRLKCKCQICENCLEELKKKFMGDFNYLNLYEIHNLKLTKCPCGNIYDINELMDFSKIKFNEEDKNMAIQRLKLLLEKKCCICSNNKGEKDKYIKINVLNSPTHFVCSDCYHIKIISKNNIITKNVGIKYENKEDKSGNKIYYNDLESFDSSLKESGNNDKKFFCNICFTEHLISQDSENKKNKKSNKLEKSINKCCGKCIIF